MKEEKIIEGFPNYTISSEGVVFNLRTQKIQKLQTDRDGYMVVNLSNDGIKKRKRVHRLVATAFIPTDDYSLTVNHKDGNKQNNSVDNLEWLSNLDNIRHAYSTGLAIPKQNPKGEKSIASKLTFNDAEQIREWVRNNTYSRKEIATMFNITTASVGNIINNKTYRACDC